MKALEIVIGLVLIYFLYSLLSSIIAEMISSWIGMRARMLKQGIENILNDIIPGTRKDFIRWLKDIFLIEDDNFKFTSAGKFYEEPNIKYLAKPGEHKWYSIRNRKPAYISNENFVITLLNMFSGKGRGISEWDKIKFAIEKNALNLDPETHKMFMDFVKRSDDRFKQFVSILQNQFIDTMDRVNGWYKRKIGLIIFYIGLIMAIAFNVDTIQIVKTLSNDKEKRLQLVELSEKVIDQKAGVDTLMTLKDTIDELKYKMQAHAIVKDAVLKANDIVASGWDYPPDTLDFAELLKCSPKRYNFEKIESTINSIDSIDKKIAACQNNLKKAKTEGLKDSFDIIEKLKKDNSVFLLNLSNLIYKPVITVIKNNTNPGKVSASIIHEKSFFSKAIFSISTFILPWRSKFWGILITALALSLGSQFWFDLLKKLVALRGAGVKPEESKEKEKQLKELKLTGETITSKDPVEIAISENRKYLESLPGVLAINKANKANTIQIIAENPDEIKAEFGDQVVTNDALYTVKIEYLQGEKASFFNNERGYIYLDNPQDIPKIRGTITGVFYNNKTKSRCYLTCAHVVQRYEHGHFEYNDSIVIDADGKIGIGNVTNLIRSSFIDAAVIDFDNFRLEGKYDIEVVSKIRSINQLSHDQLNNIWFKSTADEDPIIGKLEMESFSCIFSDNRFMYNLMLILHEDGKQYSAGGDSGALIYVHENPDDIKSKKIGIGILIGSALYDKKRYSLGINLIEVCDTISIKPLVNS